MMEAILLMLLGGVFGFCCGAWYMRWYRADEIMARDNFIASKGLRGLFNREHPI